MPPLRLAAEQSEHVAHVQISRKIFIGKIYFVIFIGKRQRTQPAFERIEFQPAHIQKHLRGKRFARNGHVRIQRYLVGEKGGEPVSKVITGGQLFVRCARRVGVGIVDKIFVIVGNVCRSLVIRIGNDGVAHAVRIHALARGITFVNGERINGPVRAERKGHFYGRKDGIIVEIAHRDHGMFIIVSGFFVVERSGKGIQPVFRLFYGRDLEHGIFVDDVVGKFARPKPVPLFILRGIEYLARFTRFPLYVAPLPFGNGGSRLAHDGFAVAEKALYRLGRRKRVAADAHGSRKQNAVFIVFAAVNRLPRLYEHDGRGDVGNAFRMEHFAPGEPADDVSDVVEPLVIFGGGTVFGRRAGNALAVRRRRDDARFMIAARKEQAQRHRDDQKDRNAAQYQLFLF